MKQLIFILSSILIVQKSFAQMGQDRGGGNMLGGKMIESYIKHPIEDLNDGRALEERLEIVRSKSEDFYSLIIEGLEMTTWYFIPSSLKQLSQNITGIPFSSNQAAIQIFDTQEIWIDQTTFNSADPLKDEFGGSIEREKLLVHEAIMAGLNSMLNGHIVQALDVSMKQFKKRIRKLTNIIFDPNLRNMTTKELLKRVSKAGLQTGSNSEVYCINELVTHEASGIYPTYQLKRCSQVSKYNK